MGEEEFFKGKNCLIKADQEHEDVIKVTGKGKSSKTL